MLIRYYGHVGVDSGYGRAAAETCMAILSTAPEFELEISTDGRSLHRDYLPLESRIRSEADLSPPDVVIVHTLPLDCGKVLQRAEIRQRFPEAVCIAYTTWEGADRMPGDSAAKDGLDLFDRVWVPSSVTAARMPHDRLEVEVMPHAFHHVEANDSESPAPSQLTRPYRFYYVGAWTARKNVESVILAFVRAFDRADDVELVIQSANAHPSSCQLTALTTGIDPDRIPIINFSNKWLPDDQIARLHANCDCFVTAARGEAWNIPAFDAMLHRNHIIAPAGLGSDDFLRETSADLYSSRLAPAIGDVRIVTVADGTQRAQPMGVQGLTVKHEWQDPDIIELALFMREAFKQRKSDLTVSYNPAQRFGRVAVGQFIASLLRRD